MAKRKRLGHLTTTTTEAMEERMNTIAGREWRFERKRRGTGKAETLRLEGALQMAEVSGAFCHCFRVRKSEPLRQCVCAPTLDGMTRRQMAKIRLFRENFPKDAL